jgi:hypothetical protein
MKKQKDLALLLYSTTFCHLCDQAKDLLLQASSKQQINWQQIDISEDDSLIAKYETKIPVLLRIDNNAELNWPFTLQDIQELII